MAEEYDRVMRQAEEAAAGRLSDFVERLGDRVGLNATMSARAVFGDPVERDGITVIPVARVRWGFGGGAGAGGDENVAGGEHGEGSGGGGGAMSSPLGFIEIANGTATFRPINDPVAMWPLLIVGSISTWIVFRAVRGLFR
jgi:uncharacterized spore protein YtfJ